jgi:hypothetical protein
LLLQQTKGMLFSLSAAGPTDLEEVSETVGDLLTGEEGITNSPQRLLYLSQRL